VEEWNFIKLLPQRANLRLCLDHSYLVFVFIAIIETVISGRWNLTLVPSGKGLGPGRSVRRPLGGRMSVIL
jgi:hypothetical protein